MGVGPRGVRGDGVIAVRRQAESRQRIEELGEQLAEVRARLEAEEDRLSRPLIAQEMATERTSAFATAVTRTNIPSQPDRTSHCGRATPTLGGVLVRRGRVRPQHQPQHLPVVGVDGQHGGVHAVMAGELTQLFDLPLKQRGQAQSGAVRVRVGGYGCETARGCPGRRSAVGARVAGDACPVTGRKGGQSPG